MRLQSLIARSMRPSRPLVAMLALIAGLAAGTGHAQAPAAAPGPNATKAELVARLVQLQQGQVQAAARTIVEQPPMQLLQQATIAIQQRVAPDKREAVLKEVQADVRKYVDDVGPIMRDSVQRLAAPTMAPLFDERLNEDDLRQLIAIFENPVLRKYDALAPDLQRALRDKLLGDVRAKFEERYRVLDASVAKRLGLGPAAPAASAPRRP